MVGKNTFSRSGLKFVKYDGVINLCNENIKPFENIQTTFIPVSDEYQGDYFCGLFALKEGISFAPQY